MKFLGGLKLAAVAGLLVLGLVFVSPSSTEAAACTNVSSFGAVTLNVPTLPNDGEVRMWVRMQAPQPSAKVLVEINGTNCLEVRGINLSDTAWSWQSYPNKNDPKTVRFNSSTGNQIRIIGINDGVKVDKVLFTPKECIPQDFGENCLDAAVAQQTKTDQNSVTALPPVSTEPVSGEVRLSSTPFDFAGTLEKLEYVADGKVVQKSDRPVEFDTTRVDNGKRTILIETTLTNGQVIRESTVIEVKNPLNPFSPLVRWAKVNANTFKIILYSLGVIILFVLSLGLLRRWVLKRRERKFRGF